MLHLIGGRALKNTCAAIVQDLGTVVGEVLVALLAGELQLRNKAGG
jgi:hypothetical protein